MPIEIRELNVRVNVIEKPSNESATSSSGDIRKLIIDTCAEMIAESKRKIKER
jgi:hypothetical protein